MDIRSRKHWPPPILLIQQPRQYTWHNRRSWS
jgi:hypothetical protein